jgi:uncharacterized metal-binding protein
MNSDHSNSPAPNKPSTVVYACSGCSDAGEIADRIARQLTREGVAQMSCLAGIGGRVKSLLLTAEKAERILVVDGCPLNCARRTLELAGFKKFDHLELHKLGIRKGSAPVTGERIATGVSSAKKILAGETTPLPPQKLDSLQTSPEPADIKMAALSLDLTLSVGRPSANDQVVVDQLEDFTMVGELALTK